MWSETTLDINGWTSTLQYLSTYQFTILKFQIIFEYLSWQQEH